MSLQPITDVARALGIDRGIIYARIQAGRIHQAEQILRPGYKRTIWLVDLDEVREHLETNPVKHYSYRGPVVPIVVEPPPPGEMTDVQHAVLAGEKWHDLVDLQPEPGIPGAVHTSWSDGESYVLLPNGEQTDYAYTKRKTQCPD